MISSAQCCFLGLGTCFPTELTSLQGIPVGWGISAEPAQRIGLPINPEMGSWFRGFFCAAVSKARNCNPGEGWVPVGDRFATPRKGHVQCSNVVQDDSAWLKAPLLSRIQPPCVCSTGDRDPGFLVLQQVTVRLKQESWPPFSWASAAHSPDISPEPGSRFRCFFCIGISKVRNSNPCHGCYRMIASAVSLSVLSVSPYLLCQRTLC